MTALEEDVTNDSLTLGRQLAEGPLPLPEALRYAMMLAEALRQIHDSGHTCGDLQPSNIALTATGLELAVMPGQPAAITPYTAPEILQGQPPDCRSDIFAFGAIVHEMVTGRRVFAGDDADALAASLTTSESPSSGTPSVDHLVAHCIAKDPNVRFQRMQKVILELKLLTFGAPRAEAVAHQQRVAAALRAETEQLEARLAALVQAHDQAIADLRQASGEALGELRGRLTNVESHLDRTEERSALVEDLCQRITANVEQVQQKTQAIDERVTGVSEGMDVLTHGAAVLEEYVGARAREFERTFTSQREAIATVVAGQRQTDDVVEGVVEAMGLLHSIVVDHAGEFA